MKKPSFLRLALLAVAASALTSLALSTQAAVVTQDLHFAFGPVTSQLGDGGTAGIEQAATDFSQFPPEWGTLISARWELTSAFAGFGSAIVTPMSTNPADQVSGTLTIESWVFTPNQIYGGLPGTNGGQFFEHRASSASCTTTTGAGPCTADVEYGETFDGVVEATNLAELTGYGAFTQYVQASMNLINTLEATTSADISSSGQVVWADRIDRGGVGRLRLVYEYEAFEPPASVPEPSSLALVGLALAGMHRLRRTRRQSSAAC